MTAAANLAPVPASEADSFAARWTFDLKESTVSPADAPEFFHTAPVGTVIEFLDELYKRLPNGSWRELEAIIQGNDFVSAEHSFDQPERLAAMALGYDQSITVLKIGRD